MADQKCLDPWHEDPDAPHETYVIPDGEWSVEGYRCKTCGKQTVTLGWGRVEMRPCPQCGEPDEGLVDEPDQVCTKCVEKNLPYWIAKLKDGSLG